MLGGRDFLFSSGYVCGFYLACDQFGDHAAGQKCAAGLGTLACAATLVLYYIVQHSAMQYSPGLRERSGFQLLSGSDLP